MPQSFWVHFSAVNKTLFKCVLKMGALRLYLPAYFIILQLFYFYFADSVIYLFDILLRAPENGNDTSQMGSGKLVSK